MRRGVALIPMNPLIKSHLDLIDGVLADVAKNLSSLRAEAAEESRERDRIQQDYWVIERQNQALQETYDRLSLIIEENESLKKKNTEAAEHARHLLEMARALQEGCQE